LCEIINSGTQPIQNLGVLQRIAALAGDEAKGPWAVETIKKGLTAFEAQVKETKGKYCVGDTVSMADICLVPQIYNANRFGMPLDDFPSINAILEALKEHPAFVKSDAANQPDAVQ
jgi:maleylacetoacetate isomerase